MEHSSWKSKHCFFFPVKFEQLSRSKSLHETEIFSSTVDGNCNFYDSVLKTHKEIFFAKNSFACVRKLIFVWHVKILADTSIVGNALEGQYDRRVDPCYGIKKKKTLKWKSRL